MRSNRFVTRVAAAGAAAVIAGLSVNAAAFAADGPGAATAKGWDLNVTTKPFSTVGTPITFDSSTDPSPKDTGGKPGLTGSGHANISTGLQYGQATRIGDDAYATKSFVQLDAPVTGTTGIPTYSASVATLKVQCVSDAKGTASGSTQIAASVPAGLDKMPAPGTTVWFGPKNIAGSTKPVKNWEMKVVYNEQTTLKNGQLQVVGMHTYYNVADRGLAGSGPITGDVALGIVACGKVNDAPATEPVPVADPAIASAAGLLALAGGFVALRRRQAA